jgi:hypothetical protein
LKQSLSIEDKYAEAIAKAVKFRHAGLMTQQDEMRIIAKANKDIAEHWKTEATAQRSRAPELAYAGSAEASKIRALCRPCHARRTAGQAASARHARRADR